MPTVDGVWRVGKHTILAAAGIDRLPSVAQSMFAKVGKPTPTWQTYFRCQPITPAPKRITSVRLSNPTGRPREAGKPDRLSCRSNKANGVVIAPSRFHFLSGKKN